MKSTEFKKNASDGVEFYFREWRPEGELKGAIALVHGMGEHINRYAHVAAFFTEKGWSVTGMDHRGHGKSGGKRGHTPSYDQLLNDVSTLLDYVRENNPNVPIILYGHSMGGNLVANYYLRKNPDVTGTLITSPWLRLAFQPPKFQVFLAKMMNGIAPGFSQSTKLDPAKVSSDPEVVKKYANDPLVHDKMSARMFLSIYQAGLWALDNSAGKNSPVLLMHGSGDTITDREATQEFAGGLGKKATVKIWDKLSHELHNEPQKEEVLNFIWDWIQKQIA